jgi:hypothetical protein
LSAYSSPSCAKIFCKSICRTDSPLSPATLPPAHGSQDRLHAHLTRPRPFSVRSDDYRNEFRAAAGPAGMTFAHT